MARREVEKGFCSHLPRRPGAFAPARCPVPRVLSTPHCGQVESRGSRKARIASTMHTATITSTVTRLSLSGATTRQAAGPKASHPLLVRRGEGPGSPAQGAAPGAANGLVAVVLDRAGALEVLERDRLDVEHELDLVRHDHAAARDLVLPRDAEVVPVDLRRGLEADPSQLAPVLVADPERRLPFAEVADVERDRPSRPADREVDLALECRTAGAIREPAAEGDLGVVLDVEEVGRAQVLIANRLTGPDSRCVDLALEGRVEATVPVELEPPVDVLEEAANPGHHHVAGAELGLGVAGFEDPGRHSTLALGVRVDDERDLVDVAPAPVLARLGRADDRMGGLVEVRGRVPVRRVVAAADVPAGLAHAQMHPPAAGPQALLAAGDLGRKLGHGDAVGVRANLIHPASASGENVKPPTIST